MNNALLLIDFQNDFTKKEGALYVDGGEAHAKKTLDFYGQNSKDIGEIFVSLDTHKRKHISHPMWWSVIDEDGNKHPIKEFTPILYDDAVSGKVVANINPESSLRYLKKLEEKGITHFIWPYHCIVGSEGAKLYNDIGYLLDIYAEAYPDRKINYIHKGLNEDTEMFGIFASEVDVTEQAFTNKSSFNMELFAALMRFDKVYVAGEAKSHCVLRSVQQMVEFDPECAQHIHVLGDCMGDVAGFNSKEDWDKLKSLGVQVI